MLDIKFIRQNRSLVEKSIKDRGLEINLSPILELSDNRRRLLAEIENLRAVRNKNSEQIGKLMRQVSKAKKEGSSASQFQSEIEELKTATSKIGNQIDSLASQIKPIEEKLHQLLLTIPNVANSSVPVGPDETYNQEVRSWGEKRRFNFKPKPHWDLGKELGILDFARAGKIAGARFTLYLGKAAKLERALINFMLDLHTNSHGYKEVFPPILINTASLTSTGQLPKLEEDMFKCRDDDLYLAPTAEVPVTNIHRDEILNVEELPIKYAAYTPCFRREAGAHGRETRGLIRQHQFNKVELVKITTPETSYEEHEKLTVDAEKVLQELDLPYRVVSLATGDLSFAAAKCYDIEVWMPSYQGYKEISSCSNFEDFQARRANIRYRPSVGSKPEFVHTLNGSGLAVGRTVAAIMENYQQADGTIQTPKALLRYLGFSKIDSD
jgi:seryl-tRNA synthetase